MRLGKGSPTLEALIARQILLISTKKTYGEEYGEFGY